MLAKHNHERDRVAPSQRMVHDYYGGQELTAGVPRGRGGGGDPHHSVGG
jgi:hypothetical protein